MKYKLSDICEYAKGKVEVASLTRRNYISTENMMPNKGGVDIATALPSTTQTQQYMSGDVLVSNIRPYFKKIWHATRNGGCSNDVLVFRAKEGVSPEFLYYVLADDTFFDYATVTSKGTKMPRGDKKSIMEYSVSKFDLPTQQKIGSVLRALDDKIELNERINKNLEEQAQAIFKASFPDIAFGEKQVGDYITPKRGKNLLSKDAVFGDVPVVAGGLSPATYHNVANTIAPVLTISASGANAGFINLWQVPVWSSDSSYIDTSMTANVYFWYIFLKERQQEVYDSQTGSAQPHIYPQHIAVLPVKELNAEDIENYTSAVTPLFKLIANNQAETLHLQQIRDTLLPKLMSGELDVSNLDL